MTSTVSKSVTAGSDSSPLTPLSASQKHARWSWLLLLVAFGYVTYFFAWADIHKLIMLTPDDAHYFFQIARNAATGSGQSFDGINPTNGFQPLWMYALVPMFWIFGGSPEFLVKVCLIYQLPFLAVAAWLLWKLWNGISGSRAALLGVMLYIPSVLVTSAKGMESCVLILTLVALLYAAWNWKLFSRRNWRRECAFGLLLGLVFLARLDMIFFAIVTAAFGLLQATHEKSLSPLKRILWIGTGSAAVVLPYLIHNQVVFGSMMPISGQLKSTFPHVSFSLDNVLHHTRTKLAMVGMMAVYLVWYWTQRRNSKRQTSIDKSKSLRVDAPDGSGEGRALYRAMIAALAAGNLLHYLYTALFLEWAVGGGWHYTSYNLFFVLAVVEWVQTYALDQRTIFTRVYRAAMVGLLLAAGYFVYFSTAGGQNYHIANLCSYDAALWARANTQPGEVFAFKDTGVFGFYSDRRTINLDGLVNNMEFQDAIRDKNLRGYFDRKGVDYLVYHAFDLHDSVRVGYREFAIEFWSKKYGAKSEVLRYPDSDELFRSPTYRDPAKPYNLMAVVWRRGREG